MFWGTLAGWLYMFSPIVYSRIIAGHLDSLIGYSILPLVAMLCIQICIEIENGFSLPQRKVIAAGIALGLTALHQSVFVLASGTVLVIFLLNAMRKQMRDFFFAVSIIFTIAILMNLAWILPFSIGFLSSGALGHGYSGGSQATLSTEFIDRQSLWESTSTLVQQSIRLFAETGVRIEYINPLNGLAATLWMLASFCVPLIAFALLLRRKNISPTILSLLLIGLVGITLVSGAKFLSGIWVYQFLKTFVPPVWAEFGNTTRAFPLVALSLCALAPLAMQQFSTRIAIAFQHKHVHLLFPNLWIRRAIVALGLLIWALPFLSGEITRPRWMNNEPMALKVYAVSNEDRAVYDWLRRNPDQSRLSYVYPPWIPWGDSDWAWTWNVGAIPARSKFTPSKLLLDQWQPASDFSTLSSNTQAGKLLGLAAVEYIVYPHDRYFVETPDVYPGQPTESILLDAYPPRFQNLKPTYDAMLAAQKDFQPLALPFTKTTIYENKSYLPRIYAAPAATVIQGSSDSLPSLANTSYFPKYPAFFFSDQLSAPDSARLATQAARIFSTVDMRSSNAPPISASARAENYSNQTIYISAPPKNATNSAGTFRLANSGAYTIRASVDPDTVALQNGALGIGDAEKVFDEIPGSAQWQVATSRLPFVADYQWASNTTYARRIIAPDSLQVRARLDSQDLEPFVQFAREMKFDLRDYSIFNLVAQVDDPKTQWLELRLGLDWDNDGVSDTIWSLPIVPESKLKPVKIDLLSAVRDAFPDRKEFRMVNAAIRLMRRPRVNLKKLPSDLFGFTFNQITFESRDATRALAFLATESIRALDASPRALADSSERGITATLSASNLENEIIFTRALGNKIPRDTSGLKLEYRVDGPDAIVLDAFLATDDPNAARTALGTRILAPFSEGTLDFNSTSFPDSQHLDIALTNLLPATNLRTTSFELTRAQFYHRALNPIPRPAVPTIKIDDRVISLAAMPPSAERSGAWFGSSTITLAAGTHSIASDVDDPTVQDHIAFIEIAPTESQKNLAPAPPTISFRQINPTRYAVHVEDARVPFYLVFSDSFHSEWKAYIVSDPLLHSPAPQSAWYEQSTLLSQFFDGEMRKEIPDHYQVNGFANSWYADKTGSYDIALEFIPQRLYEVGLIVSITTLLGCITFLFAKFLRKSR
ncbi:MAG: hypothetical protein HY257_12060 [Chloroflexi bacterium]|nr:hypothetical protein [Chloroflexota bacterium]